MRAEKLISSVPLLLRAGWVGLDLLSERPRVSRLRRVVQPMEQTPSFVRPLRDPDSRPFPETRRITPPRELLTIHVELPDETPCKITIDKTGRRIEWSATTLTLFGKERRGSGTAGLILAAIPFAIAFSPILLARELYYRGIERREHLSRHSWAVLRALAGQLDAETESLLREALSRDWGEQKLVDPEVRLTVDEAADELLRCVQHISGKVTDRDGTVRNIQCEWKNDFNHQIAFADIDCTDGTGTEVQFTQGTRFRGHEARRLVKCFRSRIDLIGPSINH